MKRKQVKPVYKPSESKEEIGKDVIIISFLLVGSIVFLMVNFWWVTVSDNHDKAYIAHASELSILSQSIARSAVLTKFGSIQEIESLSNNRREFEEILKILESGDQKNSLPATSNKIKNEELSRLRFTWEQVNGAVDVLFIENKGVSNLRTTSKNYLEILNKLELNTQNITEILLTNPSTVNHLSMAVRQASLINNIKRHFEKLYNGFNSFDEDNNSLKNNIISYYTMLNSMLKGNVDAGIKRINNSKVQSLLKEAQVSFSPLYKQREEIAQQMEQLERAQEAINQILSDTQLLLKFSTELSDAYIHAPEDRLLGHLSGFILSGITLLLLAVVAYRVIKYTRDRLIEAHAQQLQHQQSIVRLLGELANLADGDLTVHASQTSKFTTAIARSFNFTIDALRKLVTTINITAEEVATAADVSEKRAGLLEESTVMQARQITEVGQSVNDMALSIEQVSQNAAKSSDVAAKSVHIARKGAEVVQDTIIGMDSIRARIQETSKRMKRLGESSQEIGNILSLITDIAEQTNILALNAAIQASMAGDSSQGFATVADEVQRLAERTSDAVNKIEVLVNTIQTDTHEAVSSMEHSTAQVVKGATRAHDAGIALEAIEKVSKDLAILIQQISNEARVQATTSIEIADVMGAIQDNARNSASEIEETSGGLAKLTGLAYELRKSVAGFKLPQ